MTALSRLRIVANAGEPDDVLALRVDVLAASEALFAARDTLTPDPNRVEDAYLVFDRVMRRYLKAKHRRSQR